MDSLTGVLFPRIYRRSYIETSKEDGDAERAGPCAHMWWLRSQGDISEVKVLLKKCGVSIPCRNPQTRASVPGSGACITYGSENQQALYLLNRSRSLLEFQVLFYREAHRSSLLGIYPGLQ